MRKKGPFFYVANWKMVLSYDQEVAWVTEHYQEFMEILENYRAFIVCPSFVSISMIATLFQDSTIGVGAQNCAAVAQGPWTGEICAQSLAQIGCAFCIVGHSERRQFFGETDAVVAQKVSMLCQARVCPIVCVGETREEYEQKQTYSVLERQLVLVLEILKLYTLPIIIAYEPVWAIGTQIIPEISYLAEVMAWIGKFVGRHTSSPFHILYGGSVTEENCVLLQAADGVEGFLIGQASTDFQKFKNIVCLTKK